MKIMLNSTQQPWRGNCALMSQINVRNSHLCPKARLAGRHFTNRRVGKVSGRLKDRGINIALRGFHITLIVQPNYIPNHLTIPFHEIVRTQFADGVIQSRVIDWGAAKINIRVNHPANDLTGWELRQSLRAGQVFKAEQVIRADPARSPGKFSEASGAESQRAQTHTGHFEKFTTR